MFGERQVTSLKHGVIESFAQAPDGSIFITDSQKGKVWHVYRGKK